LRKGYRIAICDQMEDPKLTKKIVKREVTRVLSPGTALDAALGLRTLVRLRLRRKFAWVWMATTGAWVLLSVVVVAVLLRG